MKKLSRIISSAAAGALAAGTISFCVFAEDVELDIEAVESNGSWGQSVIYHTGRNEDQPDAFDPCTMTEDSVVQVTYESRADDDKNHIDLIWQTWGDHLTDPKPNADWNKVPPSHYEKGYSEFTYSDIVSVYGTDDFSEVYAICVGDCGDTSVTVTKLVITNVGEASSAEETSAEEETTASEEESTSAEETTASEEETTEETTTKAEETTTKAEETTAKAEETTVKQTEAEKTAVTAESEKDEGMEAGGVVLIVAIVIVAAAIGVMIFFIKRKGPAKKGGDDWRR